MFAFMNYGQILSWNGDESCRSNVVTAKETDWYRQIPFFGVAILRNEFSRFARSVRVWRWNFFSRGFQPAFTFKTVFRALDCDLHFVQCYNMGQHGHFLCACDCVRPPLRPIPTDLTCKPFPPTQQKIK